MSRLADEGEQLCTNPDSAQVFQRQNSTLPSYYPEDVKFDIRSVATTKPTCRIEIEDVKTDNRFRYENDTRKRKVKKADRFAKLVIHGIDGDGYLTGELVSDPSTCERHINSFYIDQEEKEWNIENGVLYRFVKIKDKCPIEIPAVRIIRHNLPKGQKSSNNSVIFKFSVVVNGQIIASVCTDELYDEHYRNPSVSHINPKRCRYDEQKEISILGNNFEKGSEVTFYDNKGEFRERGKVLVTHKKHAMVVLAPPFPKKEGGEVNIEVKDKKTGVTARTYRFTESGKNQKLLKFTYDPGLTVLNYKNPGPSGAQGHHLQAAPSSNTLETDGPGEADDDDDDYDEVDAPLPVSSPTSELDAVVESLQGIEIREKDVDVDLIQRLVRGGHSQELGRILRQIENPDCAWIQPLLDRLDCTGRSPLHWAALLSDLESLDVLLKAGSDVNLRSESSDLTALHFAVLSRRPESIVRRLLQCERLDVNAMTVGNNTALNFVPEMQESETVRELLIDGGCTTFRRETLSGDSEESDSSSGESLRRKTSSLP